VGRGVWDGVKVKVGGPAGVRVLCEGVRPGRCVMVGVTARVIVSVLVTVAERNGVLDGVGLSALKPVGKAEPSTGIDIRKVRALAETIFSGLIGIIGNIGLYKAEI